MFLRELANPRFYASLFERRAAVPVVPPLVDQPDFEETRPFPWRLSASIDITLPMRPDEVDDGVRPAAGKGPLASGLP